MGRTKQRYAEYFQTLFIDRQIIPTTQAEIMHPLLYLLEHPDNSVKKAFNLVFFDAAGEHYDNVDNEKIREYHRYLANAAGIILLLDPNGRESIPQMHLLDKLVEDMESFTNTESVPLAVTLSKADEMAEFMSYFSAEMPAYTEDWNRNSKRVEEWFGDDRRIVNVDKFRTDFFAISALGKVPVEDKDEMGRDVIKIPDGPSPIHVIDPLLWILSEQHLI
ncbi:hypothetical protein FACS189427_06130 [Planctomycetales bacterium]|nr:hypothetical protein FACS189427_06130 [Planctomycetales bacterium]